MKMTHPLTSAVYEDEPDGSVRVTDVSGAQGWFLADGQHLRGEIRAADPHILDWVGGRKAKRQLGRLRLGSDNAASANDKPAGANDTPAAANDNGQRSTAQ